MATRSPHTASPEFTGDLDTWVWIDEENAVSVVTALEQFGFGDLGLVAEYFTKNDVAVQLGYPPLRIDILTSIDGVPFDDAWPRRMMVRLDDMDVPFIGREDLLTNKRAAGRPQDLADVDRLTQSES